jgi:hypothetical protein
MTGHRLASLRAALGFLELPPGAPELRLLHRWLDSWVGVGLITAGVERLGYRLSLSHIAEGEWRSSLRIRCGRRRVMASRRPRGRRSRLRHGPQ